MVARREQGLLVEQGDDITVGTTFAEETTGAAIAGRAWHGFVGVVSENGK